MSEQILPGDGWRLLGPDEIVNGLVDEHQSLKGEWVKFTSWPKLRVGEKASQYIAVRRRIPAKPEAMEIDHQTITCNSFNEVMARDDSGEVWRLVSNNEQARQLADWLTRYADWREAQDEAK